MFLSSRVITDQVSTFSTNVSLNLPDITITDENNKKMVEELAKGIQLIGDQLNSDKQFNK